MSHTEASERCRPVRAVALVAHGHRLGVEAVLKEAKELGEQHDTSWHVDPDILYRLLDLLSIHTLLYSMRNRHMSYTLTVKALLYY